MLSIVFPVCLVQPIPVLPVQASLLVVEEVGLVVGQQVTHSPPTLVLEVLEAAGTGTGVTAQHPLTMAWSTQAVVGVVGQATRQEETEAQAWS